MFLGSRTFTVTRRTGTTVDGDFVVDSTQTFRIIGSLQPITGRELVQLPEGERTRGLFKLYTDAVLRMQDVFDEVQADTVEYDGRELKVVNREDWRLHTDGCPHFKYELAEPDGIDGL